jgi:hypothetical protein
MMMGINAEWTLKELCELAGTLAAPPPSSARSASRN